MSRRTLFHVLLVLTMVWASLSALSNLLMALMMPAFQSFYEQNATLFPEEYTIMMQRLFEVPRGYYAGATPLYVLEILGAIYMWRLRWPGFHCYTLARLLLLLLPVLFLGTGYIIFGDIMMALLFIAIYYLLMRRLIDEQPEPPQDNPSEEQ